jgi:steroid 5-alpha reductase family enzyme
MIKKLKFRSYIFLRETSYEITEIHGWIKMFCPSLWILRHIVTLSTRRVQQPPENNYYNLRENQIIVLESYIRVHNYAIQSAPLPSPSVQTVPLHGQVTQGNANNSTFSSLEVTVCIARFDTNSPFCPQTAFYVFWMGNRTNSYYLPAQI